MKILLYFVMIFLIQAIGSPFVQAYFCEGEFFSVKGRTDIQDVETLQNIKASGGVVIHITQKKPIVWNRPETLADEDKLRALINAIQFYTTTVNHEGDQVSRCNQSFVVNPIDAAHLNNQGGVHRTADRQDRVFLEKPSPKLIQGEDGGVQKLTLDEVIQLRQKFFNKKASQFSSQSGRTTFVDFIRQNKRDLLYPEYLDEYGIRQDVSRRDEAFLSLFVFSKEWNADWAEYMESLLNQVHDTDPSIELTETLIITALGNDQRLSPEDRVFFTEYFNRRQVSDPTFRTILDDFGSKNETTFLQQNHRTMFWQVILELFQRDQRREIPYFTLDQIYSWQLKLGSRL